MDGVANLDGQRSIDDGALCILVVRIDNRR